MQQSAGGNEGHVPALLQKALSSLSGSTLFKENTVVGKEDCLTLDVCLEFIFSTFKFQKIFI